MRNTLCPRYSRCLDLAARRNRNFDCGRCRHRRSRPSDFDRRFELWRDQDSCRLLLAALFDPELYAAYNELRRRRGEPAAGGSGRDATLDMGRGEIVEPGASP